MNAGLSSGDPDAVPALIAVREAEIAALKAQLAGLRAAEQDDLRVAQHLIEHQMSPDGSRRLEDPAIENWQRSCPRLGGNMLSVSRAPDSVLHVMLADASGFGLSATVSLLPLIAPFYRMTAKGFALPAIVRELNLKICQALPEGRTVAVQLVAIDTREGTVSVWNGGMPTAFMLDGFGHHFKEFPLLHPPLGSQAPTVFDDRIEQHAFIRGEQVVMVSAGLLTAAGPDGNPFGETGLAQTLVGLPRSQRRDELIAALDEHLAGVIPDDDLSFVLIDCERQAAPLPEQAAQSVIAPLRLGHWRFALHLGAVELGRLDVVPMLLDIVGRFAGTAGKTGELFLVLSELFNNALDHGVLRLDSRLKHAPEGLETWLSLREERLAALQQGEIDIEVEQLVEAGKPSLRIRCRDSGPGFDPQETTRRLAQTAADDVLFHGRGLALIEQLTDDLKFNQTGNEVTTVLSLASQAV